MKPNLIVTFILLFLANSVLLSQRTVSEIDSILNDYDRRYRITLNESDFKLIETQASQIGSNCNMLEEFLSSRKFSTNYKIALVAEFKNWKLCSSTILDYIDLLKLEEGDDNSNPIRFYSDENFLIYQKIVKDKDYMEHFANYLFESDYLDSCEFLLINRSNVKIRMLSFLTTQLNKELVNEGSCKVANLIILKGL